MLNNNNDSVFSINQVLIINNSITNVRKKKTNSLLIYNKTHFI